MLALCSYGEISNNTMFLQDYVIFFFLFGQMSVDDPAADLGGFWYATRFMSRGTAEKSEIHWQGSAG